MQVYFTKLRNSAIIPVPASFGSIGYDLCYDDVTTDDQSTPIESIILAPGESKALGTGIAIQMPPKRDNIMMGARIFPRSGLAIRNGIDVFAGLIDNDYRGEIKVILYNSSSDPVEIRRFEKIAQLAFINFCMPPLIQTSQLENTDRGDGGFGSTGRFTDFTEMNAPADAPPTFVFNIYSRNQPRFRINNNRNGPRPAAAFDVHEAKTNVIPNTTSGFGGTVNLLNASNLSNRFGNPPNNTRGFGGTINPPNNTGGFGFGGNGNPPNNTGGFGNPNNTIRFGSGGNGNSSNCDTS